MPSFRHRRFPRMKNCNARLWKWSCCVSGMDEGSERVFRYVLMVRRSLSRRTDVSLEGILSSAFWKVPVRINVVLVPPFHSLSSSFAAQIPDSNISSTHSSTSSVVSAPSSTSSAVCRRHDSPLGPACLEPGMCRSLKSKRRMAAIQRLIAAFG